MDSDVPRYAGQYCPIDTYERHRRIVKNLCFGCGKRGHYSSSCLVPFPFEAPEEWKIKQKKALRRIKKKAKKAEKAALAGQQIESDSSDYYYESDASSVDPQAYLEAEAEWKRQKNGDLEQYGFDETGKVYLNWHNGRYASLSVAERQRRYRGTLCFNCGSDVHDFDHCDVPPPTASKHTTSSSSPATHKRTQKSSKGSHPYNCHCGCDAASESETDVPAPQPIKKAATSRISSKENKKKRRLVEETQLDGETEDQVSAPVQGRSKTPQGSKSLSSEQAKRPRLEANKAPTKSARVQPEANPHADDEAPAASIVPVKDEPLSQVSLPPRTGYWLGAIPDPFRTPHIMGMSTQDYVKDEPPPSQMASAGAMVPSLNPTQKTTPSAAPSPVPMTPCPQRTVARIYGELSPSRQPFRTPDGRTFLNMMTSVEWRKESITLPGRDSRRAPSEPTYLRPEVDKEGRIQSPITDVKDRELVDAKLSLQFTLTSDHNSTQLLHHLESIYVHREGVECNWSFLRGRRVIATYDSPQQRALAMRRFHNARIAQDVHIICHPYERVNKSLSQTTFIIRDPPIYPSRAALQKALWDMIGNGYLTLSYRMWRNTELFHAVRIMEFGSLADLPPRKEPIGILIVFPVKFEWQECFAEMNIDGVKVKVQMEDEDRCGFCKQRGHRMMLCDHYEKVHRYVQDDDLMTEHVELRDVV